MGREAGKGKKNRVATKEDKEQQRKAVKRHIGRGKPCKRLTLGGEKEKTKSEGKEGKEKV